MAPIVINASSFVSIAPAKAMQAIEVRSATIAAAAMDRYTTSIASAFPPLPQNASEAAMAAVQNAVPSTEPVSQYTTGTAAASHTAAIAAAVIHGISCENNRPHACVTGTSGG